MWTGKAASPGGKDALFTSHFAHQLHGPSQGKCSFSVCWGLSYSPPSALFGPSHSNTKHLHWAPKIHYEVYSFKFIWQTIKSVSLEPYEKSVKLSSIKPATTFKIPLFISPTSKQFYFTCCLILIWRMKSISYWLLEVWMEDQRQALNPVHIGSSGSDLKTKTYLTFRRESLTNL